MKSFVILLVLLCSASAYGTGSQYHLIKRIHLAGDGFWDYLAVSETTRRLFISHASHVQVIDLDTDKLVGDIPDTPGVHGIALAPDLDRGFISCGAANVVKIFDLGTLRVIGTVATGPNPDSIVFDPASKRVFAFNGRGDSVTVIDAATGQVVATIALGGKPEEARAVGDGVIWVNIEDKSELMEIDSRKLAILGRYSISPGKEPSGMALDVLGHHVFSVCHNRLMTIFDTRSDKLIGTVPIGAYVDGAGYDAGTGLVFSSNGEGTLTLVRETRPGKFAVVQTVRSQPGARTMVIDPKTHKVYLSAGLLIPPRTAGGRYGVAKDTFNVLEVGR